MTRNQANPDWLPTCSREVLLERAGMLHKIRRFFLQRNVLEVDTPSLSHGTITDVYLEPLTSTASAPDKLLYLQTSPEFAMKRLLAAGSGCIYQIGRAFRNDEAGRYHNPEFLMLEWYRVGFDHLQLMDEVDQLLVTVLETEPADKISYRDLFIQQLDMDPLSATLEQLQQMVTVKANGPLLDDRDQLLHCLFSILIEPELGQQRPLMVYDFPASQSALARLSASDPSVADRFEVYYRGVELANGFHELKDVAEQRQRFIEDNRQRELQGKNIMPLDERFLAALDAGLPDCAGIALGLDRLLMLKLGKTSIRDVMPFPIERA